MLTELPEDDAPYRVQAGENGCFPAVYLEQAADSLYEMEMSVDIEGNLTFSSFEVCSLSDPVVEDTFVPFPSPEDTERTDIFYGVIRFSASGDTLWTVMLVVCTAGHLLLTAETADVSQFSVPITVTICGGFTV